MSIVSLSHLGHFCDIVRDEMNEEMRVFILRPSSAPAPGLPFGVRSVGHYILPRKTFQRPYVKHFVQVFLGISGCGRLFINNRFEYLEPGTVGIYFPGMEHRLDNPDSTWEYRWWTMDGPLAVSLIEGFCLRAGITALKQAPDIQTHEKLIGALQNVSPKGERKACSIAFNLLTQIEAGGQIIQVDLLIQDALSRINASWRDPAFGINDLADSLKVHRSTLSRTFHRQIGVSMIEYLTRLRIQAAISLLKGTRMSVSEIA